MKIINVKNKIFKDPNVQIQTRMGWELASPERFVPETIKERVLHWLGYHYTFSETNQPYCVVCLKEKL